MAGEQLGVDQPDDLVLGQRLVALEVDARQVSGEVVSGLLEAGIDELGAEPPVLGQAARVLGLLLGGQVSEVEVDPAQRPPLRLLHVDIGRAQQAEDDERR